MQHLPDDRQPRNKVPLFHIGCGRIPRTDPQDIGDAAQISHLGGSGRPIRQRRNHSQAHSFQRLLEPYAVVNPYAEELFYEDDRLQARRDQPKFLNLCKAVAFLNQMKKPLKNYSGIDYIEVSREDIQQATELASELLGISLDDLSLPARNLLQLLLEMDRKTFTRKEVMDYTGWTKTRLHIHLTELIEMELVLPESQKKNQLQTYKLLYNGEGQDGRRFVLDLHGVQ